MHQHESNRDGFVTDMFALPTRAIHCGFYGAGAEDEDQREAEEAAGARAQHGQGNFFLFFFG